MKVLIVDDNLYFAERLAAALGDSSESLFPAGSAPFGLPDDLKIEQLQAELERKLQADAPPRVLINRELKLKSAGRLQQTGEKLFGACSWKFDAEFLLYSFRSLPGDCEQRVVQLPSAFKNIPLLDDKQLIELKIEDCLRFIENSFGDIQHGYKKVSPTAVDVVRLINGAVKAGRIRSELQFGKLEELLTSFLLTKIDVLPKTIVEQADNFSNAVKRLGDLYVRNAQALFEHDFGGNGAVSPAAPAQRIVVVDDEVDGDGHSPWARTLGLVFASNGRSFETLLPSKVRSNVSVLNGADLVVLDVDYEHDPEYQGDRAYGGLELLDVIKQRFPRTPVLMMSRYDEIGLYEECMSRGAFDYVTKSWTSYIRYRTQESEKDWFLQWETRLGAPLRYRVFFDDLEIFRNREIIPRLESQRFLLSLRDAEQPTADTIVALSTFFEQFVVGYLYYRGETPQPKLHDSLNNRVFKGRNNELLIAQVLRTIRNNVIHNASIGDERYDVWLFLVLLRTFYVGLVSPSQLSDMRWMSPFQSRFAASFSGVDFERDAPFFEDESGQIDLTHLTMREQRNALLRKMRSTTVLEIDEFIALAETLVKSLGVILPRGVVRSISGSASGVRRGLSRINSHIGEDYLKREYELFRPVRWLFQLGDSIIKADRQFDQTQKSILWMMMTQCWLWYFHQVLSGPNEFLFTGALNKLSTSREQALAVLNQKVIEYFIKRKLKNFVPAYGLLVGLSQINKNLEQRRKEFETRALTLKTLAQDLKDKLADTQNQHLQTNTSLQLKTEEMGLLNVQIIGLGQATSGRPNDKVYQQLQERWSKSDNELRALQQSVADLLNETKQLTHNLEGVQQEEILVSEVLESLNDVAVKGVGVIDNVEALSRRVRRQFGYFEKNAPKILDIENWLKRMKKAGDYNDAESCITELNAALDYRTDMALVE